MGLALYLEVEAVEAVSSSSMVVVAVVVVDNGCSGRSSTDE